MPPHTWEETDTLAIELGVINEVKHYCLGHQRQSALAGFIDALKAEKHLKGTQEALFQVFGKRYGVILRTDRGTKTRLLYEAKTRELIRRKRK